jgi:histidinol-phosphate aminotransferase
MSNYWSDIVRDLEPYTPGEQPQGDNITKLNTNENPYGPSPAVLRAIADRLNEDLRRYPPPDAGDLRQAIADYYQLSAEQVFVGNGSDEVLAHVFKGLLNHPAQGPLLFPDISYSFYPVFCRLFDIQFDQVPLADDFSVDLDHYRRPNGGIIFANPNAPTGMLVPLSDIENLLIDNPQSVVVVDEAYIDFGGQSAISLVNRYPNLLVVHTLSKSRSLAGMRIGCAIGSAELIAGLDRVKNSFNSYPLSHLQIAAGVAAFADQQHFNHTQQLVITERQRLTEQLQGLGFEVLPSEANFVFARHGQHTATSIASYLREKNIVIRHFQKPRIDQFLRITVGTEDQNNLLLDALKSHLRA